MDSPPPTVREIWVVATLVVETSAADLVTVGSATSEISAFSQRPDSPIAWAVDMVFA